MEFLRNLSASPLPLSWVLGIAIVFIGALWRLELPIAQRIRWLSSLVERCKVASGGTDPRNGIVAAISAVTWLHDPVKRFERTWRNAYRSNRDAAIGEIHLADFISPDDVLPASVNRHLARAIPQILIALGIVGTFVGLARALPATGSTDTSAAAMEALLEGVTGGMSLAFSTSIIGISTSLIFLWVNRSLFRNLEQRVTEMSDLTSKVFPTISEHEALHMQMTLLEDGVSSLKTVGTDISLALAEAIAPAFDKSLREHMGPAVQSIQDAVNKLLDVTSKQRTEGLERIVDTFTASMNSALGDQFQELNKVLESTVDSQKSIQTGLTEFNEHLTSSAVAQTRLIEETSRAARTLGESLDRLEQISHSLGEAAAKVAEAGVQLEVSARTAADAQAAASLAQEQLLLAAEQHSEMMTKARSELMEAWDGAVEQARGAIHQIQETTRELGEGVGDQLVTALVKFDEALSEMINRFSGTLAEVNGSVAELPPAAKEIRESVVGLREESGRMVEGISQLGEMVKGLLADNVGLAVEASAQLKEVTSSAVSVIESAHGIDDSIQASAAVMRDALGEIGEIREACGGLALSLRNLTSTVTPLYGQLDALAQQLDDGGIVSKFNRTLDELSTQLQGVEGHLKNHLGTLTESLTQDAGIKIIPARIADLTRVILDLETSLSTGAKSNEKSKPGLFRRWTGG